jgi:hypothetical protein
MKIGKAVLGGIIAALASSSMALATTCGSICLGQCEGLYGGEWSICYDKCYHDCQNQSPPVGP